MPGRLDSVEVSTRYGPVEIPWAARDEILDELRHLDTARPTVAAFEAVGASRPVELDRAGKVDVLDAIKVLAANAGGLDKIDPGLEQLRHHLVDEFDADRA